METMRILKGLFLIGWMGVGGLRAGPFSDVPREDPVYDAFLVLQEEGVLQQTLVRLPPEGALTRYEFAVATVDALDYLTQLMERVPPTEGSPPSPPPEVLRCHAEIIKLLREFRPELEKLGINISSERQKMSRFLKTVRSLTLPETPSGRTSESATRSGGRLGPPPESPEPAGRTLAPTPFPSFLSPLGKAGAEGLKGLPNDLLQSPYLGNSFPASGLSLPASLGGPRFQILQVQPAADPDRGKASPLYGARATFDLSGQATAGLTFLQAGNQSRGARTPEQVYGAEMQLPVGQYRLDLEFAQSRDSDLQEGPAQAFQVGFRGPLLPSLTVGAAYRSIDASFRSPGFWGTWGGTANPTNIRGVRLTGDYQPGGSWRLRSSYEHYLPLETRPYLSLNRTLAHLQYGVKDQVSLSVGYEFIRRRSLFFPSPPAGLGVERSITAGLAYGLSDNIFFRLGYRHRIPNESYPPPAEDDNIALSEFSVKF